MKTPTMLQVLVNLFSRVGLPKEILTNDALLCSNCVSVADRTASYHILMDWWTWAFNLESKIRQVIGEPPHKWDNMIALPLFVIQEVPQVSVGDSPFQLRFCPLPFSRYSPHMSRSWGARRSCPFIFMTSRRVCNRHKLNETQWRSGLDLLPITYVCLLHFVDLYTALYISFRGR